MRTEDILVTILWRDAYRRDRFHHALRFVVLAALLCVLLVAANVALLSRDDRYRYVMTDPQGRLTTLVPLTEPNKEPAAVAAWAVDAVTRVYTFDFANYRRQFQDAQQRYLTQAGWTGFQKAMVDSGNFTAVVANKYVTNAVPTGPARIVSSGLLQDAAGNVRWGWTVDFPVLVTYRSSRQALSQDLNIRAVVVRLPEYINAEGLGIRQIIAQ